MLVLEVVSVTEQNPIAKLSILLRDMKSIIRLIRKIIPIARIKISIESINIIYRIIKSSYQ